MASVDNEVSSETVQHEFSSPWDDSDLVLVVEGQKLHVHRLILKMASPVFKAMLSADFKEKDAAEIPLPGKKVNEFVVILRIIYPQFSNKWITTTNVEHIYRLADEYQMESVAAACREYLKYVQKTKENAMEILVKAQACKADEALQQCCEILQQWTLSELENDDYFANLDGTSSRGVLLQKAKRLEKCIKDALPQVLGLIGCLFNSLKLNSTQKGNAVPLQECTKHNQPNSGRLGQFQPGDIIRCKACKMSIIQLAKKFSHSKYYQNCYHGIYVNETIVDILEEMLNV